MVTFVIIQSYKFKEYTFFVDAIIKNLFIKKPYFHSLSIYHEQILKLVHIPLDNIKKLTFSPK